HNLPPAKPPVLSNVKNAFEREKLSVDSTSMDEDLGISPDSLGIDTAWFAYIAGKNTDFTEIKKEIECYGRGGKDWRPYFPPTDERVGVITQGVTYNKKLLNETLPVDEKIVNRIRKLEENNTIAILIIDPWSLQVKTYKEFIKDFDNY